MQSNNRDIGSFTVLVVEDSAISANIISDAISCLATIKIANSGEKALSMIQQELPDLILLDIHMPNMSGIDVCRHLKKDQHTDKIPIIFVTSDDKQSVELEALEVGGIDYISKPINASILRTRVKGHLLNVSRTNDLIQARHELANLISTLPIFISYWNDNLCNIYSNDIDGKWFNLSPDELYQQPLQSLFDEQESSTLDVAISEVKRGANYNCEVVLPTHRSVKRYVQLSFISRRSFAGERGFLLIMTDISERKCKEISLKQDLDKFDTTLRSIGDAVIATDEQGNVTFINPVAEALTGWSSEQALGQQIEKVMLLQDAYSKDPLINPVRQALAQRKTVTMPLDALLLSKDNNTAYVEDSAAPIFDQAKQLIGAVIVFHDISEAKAADAKMARLSNYDSLTSLPNRLLLFDRMEQSVGKASGTQELRCLILMNIDGFELLNSTHGYLFGDKVLVEFAEKLRSVVHAGDTLARPSGDEFAIFMTGMQSLTEIAHYCASLLDMVNQSLTVDGLQLNLSVSIGIAVYPNDGKEGHTLFHRADSAMREAKRKGRNNYRFFSETIERELQSQFADANKLRNAIDKDEIVVFYQPKVNAKTNRVMGVEALVRWPQSDGSMIFPDYFIPLAEQTRLIIPLGKYVLEKACEQAVLWQALQPELCIAVNISAVQFNPTLINSVKQALQHSGLQAKYLELEITESILINDEHSIATIQALKDLGVKLCMDDFGKGYSSLSYIKNFPIDVLKIDQSFVLNMLEHEVDRAICETIINLANNLHLSLVAEGVETQAHMNALLDMNCNVLQGYYFSKPESVETITEYLLAH